MSETPAISVRKVSKSFRLPHENHSGLKQKILSVGKGGKGYETQEVLKDISFDIQKGEFFGIVGRNGSGKSTLLKLLAGIYVPDAGEIKISGRLTPFIELGVGFNPELTGRENVFLNGALLGFSRQEMLDMYDEIVEFAELERFMDQKLKNYSSGMQVRLAFSIAIRADTNILVLDEVLAVGDESFQRKCIDVFEKYKASDRTIVLVTHSMATVEQFCDRAILLDDGMVKDVGDPRKIANEYLLLNTNSVKQEEDADEQQFMKSHGVQYEIVNADTSKPTRSFSHAATLSINIKWDSSEIHNIGVALIKNSGEYIYGPNTIADGIDVSESRRVSYKLKLDVREGTYKLLLAFFGQTAQERLYMLEKNLNIEVKNENQNWSGLVKLKHEWSK